MHERDGRPQKEVDEKKLRQLIAMGLSQDEVAAMLDISVDTISRRFADDFKVGIQKRNGRLKSELFRRAMKGSDPCLIFSCKSLCQMFDRPAPQSAELPFPWLNYRTRFLQQNGDDHKEMERIFSQFDPHPLDADLGSPPADPPALDPSPTDSSSAPAGGQPELY